MNDVVLSKKESIERCVQRVIKTYHNNNNTAFEQDYDRQDIVVLNLLRACETALDLANYVIKKHQLGLPKSSRESFSLLADAQLIDDSLATNLEKMVGFRNIAVHEYQKLNFDIVRNIVNHRLNDLILFSNALINT